MRFIHYTNADNLRSILSSGLQPTIPYPCVGWAGEESNHDAACRDEVDSVKNNAESVVFADILCEDDKARYGGWLHVLWDKDQNLEDAETVAGILFELPPDEIILLGGWGRLDMTRVSVGEFQSILSESLQRLRSKWIEPINAYDLLLRQLFDYNDIKKTSRAGRVIHYFQKLNVAVISLEEDLSIGDKLEFKGKTTDTRASVESIQRNHKSVRAASKGDEVGLKVTKRVRKNDQVNKLILEWKNPYFNMDDLHYGFTSSGFEVRVPRAIPPEWIIGYRLFESKKQIDEPWYKENMYQKRVS